MGNQKEKLSTTQIYHLHTKMKTLTPRRDKREIWRSTYQEYYLKCTRNPARNAIRFSCKHQTLAFFSISPWVLFFPLILLQCITHSLTHKWKTIKIKPLLLRLPFCACLFINWHSFFFFFPFSFKWDDLLH